MPPSRGICRCSDSWTKEAANFYDWVVQEQVLLRSLTRMKVPSLFWHRPSLRGG